MIKFSLFYNSDSRGCLWLTLNEVKRFLIAIARISRK